WANISAHNALNSSTSLTTYHVDILCRPQLFNGFWISHLVVKYSEAYAAAVELLESILYGNFYADARLPSPAEVYDVMQQTAVLRIIDNRDGTWTAIGPNEVVVEYEDGTFDIDWPSVIALSQDEFRASTR